MITIGERIDVGWNGAKALGDESLAYSEVTVEAVGKDWVVVRREGGGAYAATFEGHPTPPRMRDVLKS